MRAENEKIYDFSKLLGRIIEMYGTRQKFAVACGKKNACYVTRYLNEESYMPSDLIELWADKLDIDREDILEYFFTHLVHEA